MFFLSLEFYASIDSLRQTRVQLLELWLHDNIKASPYFFFYLDGTELKKFFFAPFVRRQQQSR